ncbi:MAG: DnaJ domain-containing protein [Chloroflexi bacterium]|nr:DnaJ domain-containing protein [Chloroflexota bacterium]
MPAPKNYYRVLQVDPEAEPEVIESAYKRLARKYHPDMNPSADTNARMKELNEAYAVLRDPTRRKEYDQVRARSNQQAYTEPKRETNQAPRTETKSPPRSEPKTPTGVVCPKCGQRNSLDEIYCQRCLHQLKAERFCVNCGAQILSGAQFCLNCGRRV